MEIDILLDKANIKPSRVLDFKSFHPIDLSKNNLELGQLDLNNEAEFTSYIFEQIKKSDKEVGLGGYTEERSLYNRSQLFEGEEPRTLHLGIDIWAKAGTPVYAPIEATVHSFDNRATHGDYGPVIILEHKLDSFSFYSLYGHLSVDSLLNKKVGQMIKQGENFARLGEYHENFHWPPHLHFQLIRNLEGSFGDYPGVCRKTEADYYLQNCPNPAVFL